MTRRWAPRGSRPTAGKPTEYEGVSRFGAVHPAPGDSSALLAPTVNPASRNHPLRFLRERVGPGVQGVLVLDRAGGPLSQDLRLPENSTLLHLPAYSPELNPVERWWAFLKSPYLSNRVDEDDDPLFPSCGKAWNPRTTEQFGSICHTEWIPPTN